MRPPAAPEARPLAQGGPVGLSGEPEPRACQREPTVCQSMPTVADRTAFGRPGCIEKDDLRQRAREAQAALAARASGSASAAPASGGSSATAAAAVPAGAAAATHASTAAAAPAAAAAGAPVSLPARGTVLWVKLRGFPFWPAQVRHRFRATPADAVRVRFFGHGGGVAEVSWGFGCFLWAARPDLADPKKGTFKSKGPADKFKAAVSSCSEW